MDAPTEPPALALPARPAGERPDPRAVPRCARDGDDDDEVAALDRLLDLADDELWDMLAGRAEPDDAALRPLVEALRAA